MVIVCAGAGVVVKSGVVDAGKNVSEDAVVFGRFVAVEALTVDDEVVFSSGDVAVEMLLLVVVVAAVGVSVEKVGDVLLAVLPLVVSVVVAIAVIVKTFSQYHILVRKIKLIIVSVKCCIPQLVDTSGSQPFFGMWHAIILCCKYSIIASNTNKVQS